MYWYEDKASKHPVVLSTRVRFARNLKDTPFPSRLNAEGRKKICEKVQAAFSGYRFCDFEKLGDTERSAYGETHLCSMDFAKADPVGRGLLINEDNSVFIMINEEDHLRIQAIVSGFDPQKALEAANSADSLFLNGCTAAFDPKLGFLTACPTNLGCAMRVSCMVHLPALTMAKKLPSLVKATDQLGFTLRGAFGEGSSPLGSIYQISNKSSFDRSEEQIVEATKKLIEQITQSELQCRKTLYESAPVILEDRIYRSLGTLKYQRRISYSEFIEKWSDLRLGASLELQDLPSNDVLDRLLVELMQARLCLEDMRCTDPETRDALRADKLRRAL